MTEYLAASPAVARSWCPGCEPLADPLLEILDVHYCDQHTPGRDGSADTVVPAETGLPANTEAGGEANRAWCELFHRELPRRLASRRRRR